MTGPAGIAAPGQLPDRLTDPGGGRCCPVRRQLCQRRKNESTDHSVAMLKGKAERL